MPERAGTDTEDPISMPAPHAAHLVRLRTPTSEPGLAARRDAAPRPPRGERRSSRTWRRLLRR